MNVCCVFVCNKKYFNYFLESCWRLIKYGKYLGDICLVIGNDLKDDDLLNHYLIKNNNVIVKYFPDIQFPDEFHKINNHIKSDGRNITKKFQWHKLYLFDIYFKQWEGIFYIDCGMKILNDISPMINLITLNTLLANTDTFYDDSWKLYGQFDTGVSKYFTKLNDKYNLNIDYFQTGIMLYDTKIIEKDTFNNLLDLSINYPISLTNEQGIMNIYFNCDRNIWKQVPFGNEDTKFYEYIWRREEKDTKYIIVKCRDW